MLPGAPLRESNRCNLPIREMLLSMEEIDVDDEDANRHRVLPLVEQAPEKRVVKLLTVAGRTIHKPNSTVVPLIMLH